MNIMAIRKNILLLLLLPTVSLVGCINFQTTPGYAKSGELVNIGLGGVKRNTDGSTLWGGASANDQAAGNVVVQITDNWDPDSDAVDQGGTYIYDVQVRALYRAFPDHTSQYAISTLDRSNSYFSEMLPYDGQWWATVELVDQAGDPLPLTAGPNRIIVSSAKLIDQTWSMEGQLSNFQIEILPGVAAPSNEKYQYAAYKHRPVMLVKPDALLGAGVIGGLQVKVDYDPTLDYEVVPRLVPVTHDPNISVVQSNVDNGDGTHSVVAFVTNSNGFVDFGAGSWLPGQSTYDDLNFAIIVAEVGDFHLQNYQHFQLDAANSFYVDINGDPILSTVPTLSRSY
jgi:hypothetical protein